MVDIRCLRARTTRVHSISTSEKNFQLCKYSQEHRFFFIESRPRSGSRPSRCQPGITFEKNQKNRKFQIGIWLVWGQYIDARASPGCWGMVSAHQDRFASVWAVKMGITHFWWNRKVALCKLEIRRFKWCRCPRSATKDCLRSSDLFSKTRDRKILTYLSQKVVEGYTHESKNQRLEGKEHRRFEGNKQPLRSSLVYGRLRRQPMPRGLVLVFRYGIFWFPKYNQLNLSTSF